MSQLDNLLDKLWKDYSSVNGQANDIHVLLESKGEVVVNDHIAFRTFNLPQVSVDVVARSFVDCGYVVKGEYQFPAKKLFAKHFEHPEDGRPKVFISELKVEEFSKQFGVLVDSLVKQVSVNMIQSDDFAVSGRLWSTVSWDEYCQLKEESEYAAWLSAFGFRANHFTVLVNALKSFNNLAELNDFLKKNGYPLNDSGGEIKGCAEKDYLQQSSTLASAVDVEFSDQTKTIPGCYYEFAHRFNTRDGGLFSGFVSASADKIFESTDNK